MEAPHVPPNRHQTVTTMSSAMIPLLSHELLATAVQMVCYFCTAVGVMLTIFIIPRG